MSADCEREIGCSLDRDAKGTLVGGICEGERLYKPANTRLLDVIPEYTRSGRVHRPRDNPSAYLRREVSSSVQVLHRCARTAFVGRTSWNSVSCVYVDEGSLYGCLNTLRGGDGALFSTVYRI